MVLLSLFYVYFLMNTRYHFANFVRCTTLSHSNIFGIVDIGTSTTKFGTREYSEPIKTIPTVIGFRPYERYGYYVGRRAVFGGGLLKVVWPVANGQVIDWYSWEMLITHIISSELGVPPSNCSLFLVEAFNVRMSDRIKKAEILFESIGVKELYISDQVIASLFSSRNITGLVVHSSDSETVVAPIVNGVFVNNGIRKLSINGNELTRRLMLILENRGIYFPERIKPLIIRDMKEKMCYVALDFMSEMEKAKKNIEEIVVNYELPDGQTIQLGEVRFRIPEVMFESKGLPDVIVDSLAAIDDAEIASKLVSNIVLSGGNTMFKNFLERLKIELRQKLPDELRDKFRINTTENRANAPYIGAQIMMKILIQRSTMVTKQQWIDEGINSILKMF